MTRSKLCRALLRLIQWTRVRSYVFFLVARLSEDVRKPVKQRRHQNAGPPGSERRQAGRVRGSHRRPHGEKRAVHSGARAPVSPHGAAGHPAARAAGTPGQRVRYKQALQKVAELPVQRAGETERMRIHLPRVHVSESSQFLVCQWPFELHMWLFSVFCFPIATF